MAARSEEPSVRKTRGIAQPIAPHPDTYSFAYPDLAMLRSEAGPEAIAGHWELFGRSEGRIAPRADRPDDWSDTLARNLIDDPSVTELVDLGILSTYFYFAAAHRETLVDGARTTRAPQLCKATQLPEAILPEVLDIDRLAPASSLLFDLFRGATHFHGMGAPLIARALGSLRATGWTHRGAQVAFVLPWLRAGGAELEALWLYKAAEKQGLSPVMILTETSDVTPFFADQKLRIVSLPKLMEASTGVGYGEIYIETRKAALDLLIAALGVANVHVVHSWTAYNLLVDWSRFGRAARPKVVVSAFCSHLHSDGRIDGYFRMFPDIDAVVDLYLFDNEWYNREIATLYGISARRRGVLSFPVSDTARLARRPDRKTTNRILWASRIDYQKNIPALFAVASRMPTIAFDVFGKEVLGDEKIDWRTAPKNVMYRGEYFDFTRLPHDNYDAFLYTSIFDGMPNVILEAAQAALPIVSAPAGGVGEFLGNGVGLVVDAFDDIDGYVAAVARVVADPALAADMTAAALGRLKRDHNFAQFAQAVAAQGVYASAPEPAADAERLRRGANGVRSPGVAEVAHHDRF